MITGEYLREARRARGVGLRGLAAQIGRDRGHLSRIERGMDDRKITPALVRDYARALKAPELLNEPITGPPLVAATAHPFPALDPDEPAVSSDPMRRRTLVLGSLTTAAIAVTAGDMPAPVGQVTDAQVAALLRGAQRLYSLDYQHGGDGIWQAARSFVGDASTMLEHGSYTSTVGDQLVQAAGRVQMCQGWLAFDAGKLDVARGSFTEALALARQAGDAEVETHALAHLAFLCNLLRRPREAVRFADGAERAAAISGIPRLAAVPQLRQAIAAAMHQDATTADHAVTAARTVVDRDADKPTSEWCAFVGPAELDGVEGTAAIDLRRFKRAEELLTRAIDGYGERYARNRALYQVRLARARLAHNTPDGAAQATGDAMDSLSGNIGSWRVGMELAGVIRNLAPYRTLPDVDTVLTRYEATAA